MIATNPGAWSDFGQPFGDGLGLAARNGCVFAALGIALKDARRCY